MKILPNGRRGFFPISVWLLALSLAICAEQKSSPLPPNYLAVKEISAEIESLTVLSSQLKSEMRARFDQFESEFNQRWSELEDIHRKGKQTLEQLAREREQWNRDNARHEAEPHLFKLPDQQAQADSYNREKTELEERDAALISKKENDIRKIREEYLAKANALNNWLANSKSNFIQTARSKLSSEIQTKLSMIDQRIPNTRSQIEKYAERLKDFQESLDEWSALPSEARKKALEAAKETLATALLEGLTSRKEKAIELNEDALHNIKNLLRKRVQIDDLYAQVLTDREIDMLKTDRDILGLLNVVKDGLGATGKMPIKDREAAATVLLKTIGIVNTATHGQPEIGLLIADGELAIADVYAWKAGVEARARIEQLLQLSDQRLVALKSLTNLYKVDIDNRNALRDLAGRIDLKD